MTEVLFDWLARTSVQVAILVTLVVAVQLTVGRWLTPRWRYALWLLVLARLTVPFELPLTIGSPSAELTKLCFGSEPPTRRAHTSDTTQRTAPARAIDRPVPRRHKTKPASSARDDRGPATRQSQSPKPRRAQPSSPSPTPISKRIEPTPINWRSVAIRVWSIAAALLLGLALARTRRFYRRLDRATAVPEGTRARQLLDHCCAQIGVGRSIELVESDAVTTPAVAGLRRARLLMPPRAIDELDDSELRHVFLHELAHLKRGDLIVNQIAHLVACVYWFHPCVWFALRELRTTREAARDFDALRAAPEHAPIDYARTLLKLCERRAQPAEPVPAIGLGPTRSHVRDLQRRILMITRFGSFSRAVPAIGAAALVTLTWVSFTDASPQSGTAKGNRTSVRQVDGLAKIPVERHRAPPPWRRAIEQALAKPVSVAFDRTFASEALAYLRELTGANIVVQRDLLDSVGDPELTLKVQDTPLSDLLELMCREIGDCRYTISREVIFIGDESAPQDFELRFYQIGAFYDGKLKDRDIEDPLLDLIRNYVSFPIEYGWDENPWENEHASIEVWNRLLVVSQTAQMHEQTEAFLNRLLNRGAEPASAKPTWRKQLEHKLQTRTKVRADDEDTQDLLTQLAAQHDVSILAREYSGETTSIRLDDVTLASALDWIAAEHTWSVHLDNGVIHVDSSPPRPQLEFFEMGNLYQTSRFADSSEVRHYVMNLIENQIAPDAWEHDRMGIEFWKDMMLVNATPSVHEQVRLLLAALERSFRG